MIDETVAMLFTLGAIVVIMLISIMHDENKKNPMHRPEVQKKRKVNKLINKMNVELEKEMEELCL